MTIGPMFFLHCTRWSQKREGYCRGDRLVTAQEWLLLTYRQIYEKRNHQGNQDSIIWWRPLTASKYSVSCNVDLNSIQRWQNDSSQKLTKMPEWIFKTDLFQKCLCYPIVSCCPTPGISGSAMQLCHVMCTLVCNNCLTQSMGWVWLEALMEQLWHEATIFTSWHLGPNSPLWHELCSSIVPLLLIISIPWFKV